MHPIKISIYITYNKNKLIKTLFIFIGWPNLYSVYRKHDIFFVLFSLN